MYIFYIPKQFPHVHGKTYGLKLVMGDKWQDGNIHKDERKKRLMQDLSLWCICRGYG